MNGAYITHIYILDLFTFEPSFSVLDINFDLGILSWLFEKLTTLYFYCQMKNANL